MTTPSTVTGATIGSSATPAPITLYGDAGKDRIEGYGDDDVIRGGAENDTLIGDEDDDQIYGEEGDDRLFGDIQPCAGASCEIGGDDLLDGGPGAADRGNGGPREDTCTNLETSTACEP